jgi:hypothetical protein
MRQRFFVVCEAMASCSGCGRIGIQVANDALPASVREGKVPRPVRLPQAGLPKKGIPAFAGMPAFYAVA